MDETWQERKDRAHAEAAKDCVRLEAELKRILVQTPRWHTGTPEKQGTYQVLHRNQRTGRLYVRAADWCGQFELPCSEDSLPGDTSAELNPRDEEWYAPAGWYRVTDIDDTMMPVYGEVLAWSPLLGPPDEETRTALGIADWEPAAMLKAATVVDVDFPGESHCDQCDLQGVCSYLHDRDIPGRACKAFPRVYRLPEGYNKEIES